MTETTKKTKKVKADAIVDAPVKVRPKAEQEDVIVVEEAVDMPAEVSAEEGGKAKRSGKKDKYFEAVGRRKTAVARVRLFTKMEGIKINDKTLKAYFGVERFEKDVESPLEKMKIADKLGAIIKVKGGGPMAQAQAARLGIARALIEFNPVFQKRLRRLDLLTRDPRAVERKKPGLKKARRAPQWKKR